MDCQPPSFREDIARPAHIGENMLRSGRFVAAGTHQERRMGGSASRSVSLLGGLYGKACVNQRITVTYVFQLTWLLVMACPQ